MADTKISALAASTTPLAGTEVLPIVQSGTTKQVSVANLTAGRAVSAASLALTTTPLPVTSGGTGLATLTANYIPYGNGTSALNSSANFSYNGTRLLVGTSTSSGSVATFYGSQQSFIIRNGVNSDYNEFGVWDGASDQCKAVIKNEGGVAKFGSRTNSNVGIQVNDSVVATFSGALGTGLVYTNGGVFTSTNPSDERLKSDIENLSWGLDSILALRPVSYTWNNDVANQGKQYGFIAQEVQTVMPELVREFEIKEGEETIVRLGLEKEGIYAAMVKAIQEQQALIADMASKLKAAGVAGF